MQLFQPENRSKSLQHKHIYAVYEIWYTTVDFAAAFLFVIGSVFFFWKSTETLATWMFLIGSICFALKPTIRLARELHYVSIGDFADLARRDKR